MRVISRLFLIVLVGLLFVGCGKKSGIEGKVVDGKGNPMANVKIIANQVHPIKGYEHFEATTGSDGKFRFKGLFPTSEYILFAWGETLEPQTKMTVKSGPEGQISMLPSDMVIRFTPPKDGVITDTWTGLQWAQDAGSPQMNWNQANTYVQSLKIGGHSDWRLPSKEEFESLLNYAKSREVKGFKNVQSHYWSSTSHVNPITGNTDRAWYVDTQVGHLYVGGMTRSHYYVLPVRSGQ